MTLIFAVTQLMAIRKFGRSAPSDLSAITQPTLIANGDNDRMVPTVLSEDLHRRIKGSELVIYPDSGLIDQFRVWTFPIVVGPGERLFGGGTVPIGLRLVDSKTSTTGVVIATYELAGAITYGNFDFEEPTEAELARRRKLAAEG